MATEPRALGLGGLADALGSGLSSCKGVRVQVPPSALEKLAFLRVFCFLALVFVLLIETDLHMKRYDFCGKW